ncbi:MAG TPA: LysR family transcriptional regulator [Coriobacteriia bacterium]|nr:LysR family transcriptional regulator [Coriobacteriia bacterium]
MNVMEQKLRIFKEVADLSNITLASKILHMSQPSVSIQIHELERELGVRLFDRSNKGVVLTQEGQVFYGHAYRLIESIEVAKTELLNAKKNKRNCIHIGATLTIGEYLLPRIAYHFSNLYRDADFCVTIENTKTVTKDLLERHLNIALVEGPIPADTQLTLKRFWHDELALIVPNNERWKNRESITFEELTRERMVLREKGSGTREIMELALMHEGFDPKMLNVIAELSSTQAIKIAVLDGLGVSIISKLTVQQECRLSIMKTLSIEECHLARPLNILIDEKRALSKEEELFIEFLSDEETLASFLSDSSDDDEKQG